VLHVTTPALQANQECIEREYKSTVGIGGSDEGKVTTEQTVEEKSVFVLSLAKV
jgi:hypothetical protein